MNIQTLREIITDMPVYEKLSCKLFDNDDINTPSSLSGEAINLLETLFKTRKVDIKCVECNKEYPFYVEYEIKKISFVTTFFKYTRLNGTGYCSIDSIDISKFKLIPPDEDEGIISYVFTCTMNQDHYQTMYLLYHLKGNDLTIRKIGQKPINIDLKETYSNEYRIVLNKYDAFEDYRHYEQSESRGLLAGACTYLRRVLEKLVLCKINDESISNEDRKKANHFDEKIKLVLSQFDDDVRELLKSSYKLLSKGIHELANEEIDEFYRLILEVINIQLESEKEKMQSDKKRKELRNKISNATNKNK